MPKDIIFPPLSEVVTDVKNNSVSVLKFPKSFESVVYLDLPAVINSKLDIVLDGPKLDKKPYDVDLDYVYFNDLSTTSNSSYTFGNYIKTTISNEKIINYDAIRNIKSRKFISEEEEKYENNIISRGTEVVPKNEPLVGQFVNLSNVMHLFHNNVLGSNLIFEDFTVDFDNVIKMKYKNYGSNQLVLHKPISMEPLIPPQDFFKTTYNQIVKCFGNKVLVCSKRFGLSRDAFEIPPYTGSSTPYIHDFDEIHVHTVTNGQITSSENISNVATFRCTNGSTGFAGLSNVITWSNPTTEQHLTYGTFAACENIVDADEYFVAFTTYNNKVIFYDSKTGWENKTGTSIADTPTGLLPAEYSFTYQRTNLNVNSGRNISEFKRPMSIKHFQSTGNVHALVCGASSNSSPNIAKSTDNLETFVPIFIEGNLSAFNITPYGSGDEKSRYDTQTDTKIINEKMYDPEKLNEANKLRSSVMKDTENLGCREADLTVMCSEYYASVCPFKCKKMTVIPNGIDIKEFEQPIEFKYPHGEIHLLYIGRFNIQKGVDLLLNLDLPSNVHLYFAGSNKGGNLYPYVIEACKHKNNFHFLGELKGTKKVGALQKAHAVLFPSRHEPFGIVGLEAMISKTILITTRTGGISSYVDSDMCIECTESTINESINKFLNTPEKTIENMIHRCYERAKKYDWENIYVNYKKWLL